MLKRAEDAGRRAVYQSQPRVPGWNSAPLWILIMVILGFWVHDFSHLILVFGDGHRIGCVCGGSFPSW